MDRNERSPQLILWVCLLAAWVMMLVLIDPRGEFPLNDDWAYARAVKTLHDQGRLELPSAWASMTLVAHVVWGWLITIPFGFSFFILRMWNLVPALAGIIGVFVLLREAKVSRRAAFIAAAATAFNPLYAQLSLSFMTDITFFAVALWSAIFFLRALRDDAKGPFWIGLALSLMATMIRQHGVFLALAWAVVYLRKQPADSSATKATSGRRVIMAALPFLVHAAYLTFHRWAMGPVFGSASMYAAHETVWDGWDSRGWGFVADKALSRIKGVFVFAGVSALPIWLSSLSADGLAFGRHARRAWMMAACGAAAVLTPLLWKPYIPQNFHIIHDFGVGPALLRDTYLLWLPNLPTAPKAFWILFTIAGLFGGALLLLRWIEMMPTAWRRGTTSPPHADVLLLLTMLGAGCFALLAILPLYDRYMILFMPLLFLVAAPRAADTAGGGFSIAAAASALLLIAVFSTAGLHDYFAWNRARWSAIEWLTTEQGVGPDQMDAGVEYHGWNTYDPNYTPRPGKSWWWVTDDEYLVTFGAVPGYEELSSYSYHAWLPPEERAIHVLQRMSP